MIIYKVTNIVNGRSYIGQTVKSLRRRKSNHISDTKVHKYNSHFHNAMRKYGLGNFKWEIIHGCNNINFLDRLEIFYIGYYDTYNNGYNLTFGGRGRVGHKASDATRKKISIAISGKNNPNYGKKYSIEARKKMSEAKRGKNNPNYGKEKSVETKRKMSEAHKVNSYDKAVVIEGKHFNTLKKAAEFVGIGSSGVRKRILHKTKWMDYYYVENVMEVQDVKGNS